MATKKIEQLWIEYITPQGEMKKEFIPVKFGEERLDYHYKTGNTVLKNTVINVWKDRK